MIALYQYWAGFAFLAIYSSAGYSGDYLVAYYRFSVGHNSYHPANQRNIIGLPLTWILRHHFIWRQETID